MGSHSATCHPTRVNAPRHNSSETGIDAIDRFIYPEEVKSRVNFDVD